MSSPIIPQNKAGELVKDPGIGGVEPSGTAMVTPLKSLPKSLNLSALARPEILETTETPPLSHSVATDDGATGPPEAGTGSYQHYSPWVGGDEESVNSTPIDGEDAIVWVL